MATTTVKKSKPKLPKRTVVNPSQIMMPNQAQKLTLIANRLGLPGLAGMQGTTFNIFDTILLASNSNPTILDFFSNTANKSLNFSNFQNGSLKAGEAMLLEEASFFLVQLTAGTLIDSTGILDIKPLSEIAGTGIVSNAGSLKLAQLQIDIANQTTLKSMNIYETNPEFNPRTTGTAAPVASTADAPFTTFGTTGQNKIPLESPSVLPPNLALSAKLRIPPIGTLTGTWAIMCVLGRFGCIYASKGTL